MSRIVEIAFSHLGEKEIPGNRGWLNKKFEAMMKSVSWYFRAPWCAFFCKLVWKEAGQDVSLLSGSTSVMIDKATKAGNWHSLPVEGAIVIWATFKNGKRQKSGHAGIVTDVGPSKLFETIEGNTTDKGGREGEVVARRIHSFSKPEWSKWDGLRLMGFIHPK